MWPDLASGAFFAAVLSVAEIARRGFGVSPDVTRKVSLGAIGVWAVPAVFLFPAPARAAVPFLLVAFALYLSFRFELLLAIEDVGASLGSVLAPLSAAALLFFVPPELSYVAVAGILAGALGDTTAALVGRRRGTRRYRVWGHARTMEGTLAFFLAASTAQAIVLVTMGSFDAHQAIAFALIAGTVAAGVETISVPASDNLTVPLAAALTLLALIGAVQ